MLCPCSPCTPCQPASGGSIRQPWRKAHIMLEQRGVSCYLVHTRTLRHSVIHPHPTSHPIDGRLCCIASVSVSVLAIHTAVFSGAPPSHPMVKRQQFRFALASILPPNMVFWDGDKVNRLDIRRNQFEGFICWNEGWNNGRDEKFRFSHGAAVWTTAMGGAEWRLYYYVI